MINDNAKNQIRKVYVSEEYFLGRKCEVLRKNFKSFHYIKALRNLCFLLKYKHKNSIYFKTNNNVKINNDIDFSKKRIAIYTCITGKYDDILEPFFVSPNVDYIVFTDSDIKTNIWIKKSIPEQLKNMNNAMINRYIKLHPYEILDEYDYVMYIDGNVHILDDVLGMFNSLNLDYGIAMHTHYLRNDVYDEAKSCIKFKKGNKSFIIKQMRKYKENGFPEQYGLLEATIIVSDVHNSMSKDIFDCWWNELVESQSMRDQLSLPYVLWKKNIKIDKIGTLGDNEYANTNFFIISH